MWLLAEGHTPLPLRPRSKGRTYLPHWTPLRDQVPTEAEVRSWWRRWPDAQLARIVPAGQCVVDIDPRNGGLESLAALDSETQAAIAAAPRVWSGRGDGGFHAWLSLPAGLVTFTKCEPFPGIDVLPPGRLEVVAPSLHKETGEPYRWEGRGRPLPTLPPPLVPRPPRREQTTGTGSGAGKAGPPISPELLAEWEQLWSLVGITLGSGERSYRCPWHEDQAPSLSIHRERGVWICHAGCGGGKVSDLRHRLGVSVSLGGPKGLSQAAASTIAPDSLPSTPRQTSTRSSCPNAVPLYYLNRHDGRKRRVRAKECGQRSCPVCGPARADAIVALIAETLEAEDLTLYAQVLEASQLRAWKARVDRAGHRRKQFPAPGGLWRVFTTWEAEGSEVEDLVAEIREAHQGSVSEGRRKVAGSRCWALTHSETTEAEAEPSEWECKGVVTASLQWAIKQAERITGSKPTPLLEHGRQVGFDFELTGTDEEAEAQWEAFEAAAGVMDHKALAERTARIKHQARLLEAVAA